MKIQAGETSRATDVPADLGRDRVTASLLHGGPATAATLAARIGISATAVRRHLDTLEVDGLVVATDRPPYGPAPRRGRGRPAKVFALTAAGRATFPDAYDDLALSAVEFLVQHGGEAALSSFAQLRARELQKQLEQTLLEDLGQQWREEQAEALVPSVARTLSAMGFAASIDPAPMGLQLCQHNCPVSQVAARYPVLCEAETDAFASVLGHHVQRIATIATGAGVCTTVIPTTTATATAIATDERTSA